MLSLLIDSVASVCGAAVGRRLRRRSTPVAHIMCSVRELSDQKSAFPASWASGVLFVDQDERLVFKRRRRSLFLTRTILSKDWRAPSIRESWKINGNCQIFRVNLDFELIEVAVLPADVNALRSMTACSNN